jgi:hypothetical protein
MKTREGLLAGGESGEAAVVPGNPEASPLVAAIRWDGYEMPPKENDRLSPEQIEQVVAWIRAGAPWPSEDRLAELEREAWQKGAAEGEVVATSGGLSDSWTNRRYDPADLWAYRPIRRPDLPPGSTADTNPIDAFVGARLQAAGIEPAPPADPRSLIRRLSFDLTGLPPLPEDVERFVADPSPEAYAELVERLLASPRYGERMAQHWLDVVRYADSDGFSNDFDRPAAWRYRDYVIRSFNQDRPYDEFIVQQIAGDELDASDPENLIAVGFLRMGPWEHTAMSVAAETRQQWLDDVTGTVGVTFLATEMSCFQCHDHKFDPLPTRDYYRLQAVFATTQFTYRKVPFLPEENTRRIEQGRVWVQKLIDEPGILTLVPEDATQQQVEEAELGVTKVRKKQRQQYEMRKRLYDTLALSVYNGPSTVYMSPNPRIGLPGKVEGPPPATHILTGGSIASPGEPVVPGVLSLVSGLAYEAEEPSIPESLSGRRLALARWIASPENPLTARVMANRIWQMHMGQGIAANPNSFGKMGAKPTHPELLDWLASEFMANGWSVKHLHRVIVMSDTYRRGTQHPDPERLAEVDPERQLHATFLPRRLSAEELRDTVLSITGELNLEEGGLPVYPEIHPEVAMQPRHVMGSVAPAYQPEAKPEDRHRRTIYAVRIRTLADPALEVFDRPGSAVSCEARSESTVTPQVFSLFNSVNSRDRALAWAKRLEQEAGDPRTRIDQAFRLALGRAPSPDEITACLDHLEKMIEHHRQHPPRAEKQPAHIEREMVEEMTGLTFQWKETLPVFASADWTPDTKPWDVSPETRALADVCLVLMNANEFIYVY